MRRQFGNMILRKDLDVATPTENVAAYVESLVNICKIQADKSSLDRWADQVTALAGDLPQGGITQDQLIALVRAGCMSKHQMATLLVNHLREVKSNS